jgi:hypothetical protein
MLGVDIASLVRHAAVVRTTAYYFPYQHERYNMYYHSGVLPHSWLYG